ncbi:MAG: hypothetical protein Q8R55_05300 [Candidatus Taylorbacteria bacterium]|nr:hypothetical protein [Candidatus Taylorbacteria bacterium]
MDISELKKLIKNSTAVLVLDDGEPSFVMLGYNTYKDMVAEKGGEKEIKITQNYNGAAFSGGSFHEKETEILDRLNKEILALKNQIEMEEKGLSSSGLD